MKIYDTYSNRSRFITDFEKHCVDFVDAAVDPTDPEKWQEAAKGNVQANYWGFLGLRRGGLDHQ